MTRLGFCFSYNASVSHQYKQPGQGEKRKNKEHGTHAGRTPAHTQRDSGVTFSQASVSTFLSVFPPRICSSNAVIICYQAGSSIRGRINLPETGLVLGGSGVGAGGNGGGATEFPLEDCVDRIARNALDFALQCS